MKKCKRIWPQLAGILFLAGCAGPPARSPLPEELSTQATVRGMSNVRMWGDEVQDWQMTWRSISEKDLQSEYPEVRGVPHHYLALSGGGQYGAFGAGVMKGWTARGDRPEFTIVTGISAGALIAPFAFLGSAYDNVLEKTFTGLETADVASLIGPFKIARLDALSDNKPLREQIERYVTMDVLHKIATEHRKGRRLYIGTTHLDAQRPVVWNIGKISAAETPEALKLVQEIILTSTAIPGAFPPLLLEVEIDGVSYDEVHVDGGIANVVFAYPPEVDFRQIIKRMRVRGHPQMYMIANQFLEPSWDPVELKLLDIGSRSMLRIVANQTRGDLHRIYALCKRDGLDFHLISIPPSVENNPQEPFDTEFMRRLFKEGATRGSRPESWATQPPGWVER
jgi:predicted acylesterase/phospholipase RssA